MLLLLVDGVRVRSLRLDAGLTINELAKRSGASRKTIRQMESEDGVRFHQKKSVCAIAKALECDPNYLASLPDDDPEAIPVHLSVA